MVNWSRHRTFHLPPPCLKMNSQAFLSSFSSPSHPHFTRGKQAHHFTLPSNLHSLQESSDTLCGIVLCYPFFKMAARVGWNGAEPQWTWGRRFQTPNVLIPTARTMDRFFSIKGSHCHSRQSVWCLLWPSCAILAKLQVSQMWCKAQGCIKLHRQGNQIQRKIECLFLIVEKREFWQVAAQIGRV